MKKQYFFFLIFAGLVFASCKDSGSSVSGKKDFSKVQVDQDSESQKFSYSIGVILGNSFRNNGIDSINYTMIDRAFGDDVLDQDVYSMTANQVQALNSEEVDLKNIDLSIVKKAIYDLLVNDSTSLPLNEVGEAYQSYMESNNIRVGDRNLEAGRVFLDENAGKEGVETLPSGLQYKLITSGEGAKPTKGEVAEVYLTGSTVDGKEFMDNSTDPSYVDLTDTQYDFPGLAEGIQLFPYGSEFDLFIPPNLAFNDQRLSPEVGPNSTLVIHVKNTVKLNDQAKKEYLTAKEDYRRQMQLQMQQMQQMQQLEQQQR